MSSTGSETSQNLYCKFCQQRCQQYIGIANSSFDLHKQEYTNTFALWHIYREYVIKTSCRASLALLCLLNSEFSHLQMLLTFISHAPKAISTVPTYSCPASEIHKTMFHTYAGTVALANFCISPPMVYQSATGQGALHCRHKLQSQH